MQTPSIPYDIYESKDQWVCIIPLGGILKESITITIKDYALLLSAQRQAPTLSEEFTNIQQECYRWDITATIDIPGNVDINTIQSTLTKENILHITLPKKTLPDTIPVIIE